MEHNYESHYLAIRLGALLSEVDELEDKQGKLILTADKIDFHADGNQKLVEKVNLVIDAFKKKKRGKDIYKLSLENLQETLRELKDEKFHDILPVWEIILYALKAIMELVYWDTPKYRMMHYTEHAKRQLKELG